MRTFLFAALCVASTAAFAQAPGDDWNTFPPGGTPPLQATPPTVAQPPPDATPPIAPPPPRKAPTEQATPDVPLAPAPASAAPAPGPPPPDLSTPAPVATPAAPATGPAKVEPPEVGADQATVISTKERFVPGSEPHSAATWQNAYNDKKNHRYTASATGGIGLLHVQSADLGLKGLFRVSATGEYFQSGSFPVQNAIDTRTAGTFAVSFVPLEWLETYVSYAAAANTNSLSTPPLIETLGDLGLGAKASRQWVPGLWAGVDVRILSFAGVGNQDVRRYAWGIAPRLLGSYDIRQAQPKVPLIAHANLGFVFDGTGNLASTHQLNASEEFALGVDHYNRFSTGLGLEAPLPAVTPFIEYDLAVPLGAKGLLGPDQKPISVGATMPQTLALGAKVTAIKDLTLMLAFDIGLARSVALGVPATMPFNMFVAASFNVDPFQRGDSRIVETIRERKVEKEAKVEPKTGKVTGVITDAQTHKPIPGVIVAMVGAGLPPVATDTDNGRFLTHELPSGQVKLQLQKDGYKDALQELTIEAGKTESLEVALDPLARNAHFEVTVTSKKKPVAATVALKGPVEQQVSTVEGAKEAAKVEAPAGKYLVNVTAPGYLAQTREVQVSENAAMQLAFDLNAEPKKKLVIFKDNKIEILQQVHFATGKATILADSFQLLNQVIDVIIVNGVKRLKVEGHTDNRGNKVTNLTLSEDRAKAVAEYMVKAGIDVSRIEAVGYGDTRPVAPNLTARGRELNRRVEFVILER